MRIAAVVLASATLLIVTSVDGAPPVANPATASAAHVPVPAAAPKAETSCIHCHGGELFDDAGKAKVRHFGVDVHAQVGLSCHDCHGGNPDPKLGDDIGGAMDPKFKPNPYAG